MPRQGEPTEAEVEAALAALTEPDRFRAAEQRVARVLPELQRILTRALREGGWFDEAHESQLRRVAGAGTEEERMTLLRTLIAEETRLGMLIGVAVGWELGRELDAPAGGARGGDAGVGADAARGADASAPSGGDPPPQ